MCIFMCADIIITYCQQIRCVTLLSVNKPGKQQQQLVVDQYYPSNVQQQVQQS